jgi:D-alanyl-D-alanine carboxypeptidase
VTEKGVISVQKSRKRKIMIIIFIDILLVAILISCVSRNINKDPDRTPPISQNPVSTPVATVNPESTPPLQEEQEPEASTISVTPAPDNVGDIPDNSELPYYKQDNAERYAQYQKDNPDMPFEQIVVYVNIGLDMAFYEGVRQVMDTDRLDVLVNKYNKLPDDFSPELVKLPETLCVSGVGDQYLREEAKQALMKMHEDAKKEGLDIRAYGTYRSIPTQHYIWNNAVNSGRTKEDVDSLNARGGHSEHHTGLAVDVIMNNYSVEDTPEYQWYKDRVHEYGFIIRYPEGKEHITGYKYEPWHLRYVGTEIATGVYNSGLTYDEYYVTYLENLLN